MIASEVIGHVNDLLSTFLAMIFEESDRRNMASAREGADQAEFTLRRSMLLEEFRDLMESAILNNGALSDPDIGALQIHARDPPSADRVSWGAWGQHYTAYQVAHSMTFDSAMDVILNRMIRTGTSWNTEPLKDVRIVVRQTGDCMLLLFRCLQHVVHSVVFSAPWVFIPACQSPAERVAMLDDLEDQTLTAIILEHIQICDPQHSALVVDALKRALTTTDGAPPPRLPRLHDIAIEDVEIEVRYLEPAVQPVHRVGGSEEDGEESESGESEGETITATIIRLSDCVRGDPNLHLGDGHLRGQDVGVRGLAVDLA